jgi:hypothetical protein
MLIRIVRVGASAAIVCAVVVGGSGAVRGTTPDAPRSVRKWSASICTDFARWQDQLVRLASTGGVGHILHGTGTSDPPDVIQAGVSQLLAGALLATDELVRDVRAAGVPKIPDGQNIAAEFAGSAAFVSAAFADFKRSADQVAPDEPGQQFRETQDLASLLQRAGTTLSTTLQQIAAAYPKGGIKRVFASTKACKPLL